MIEKLTMLYNTGWCINIMKFVFPFKTNKNQLWLIGLDTNTITITFKRRTVYNGPNLKTTTAKPIVIRFYESRRLSIIVFTLRLTETVLRNVIGTFMSFVECGTRVRSICFRVRRALSRSPCARKLNIVLKN